jgi:hypothetical protein
MEIPLPTREELFVAWPAVRFGLSIEQSDNIPMVSESCSSYCRPSPNVPIHIHSGLDDRANVPLPKESTVSILPPL